jgi:hypothetical protein
MMPDSLILLLLASPFAFLAVRGLKKMITEARREAGVR